MSRSIVSHLSMNQDFFIHVVMPSTADPDSKACHANALNGVSYNAAHFLPPTSQSDPAYTNSHHELLDRQLIDSTTQASTMQGSITYQTFATVNRDQACSKERPRCYEHGCDGRTFSCWENYRRHIREKTRSSAVMCTICGLSFSRKSNRDKHILDGRCKVLAEALTDTAHETAGCTLTRPQNSYASVG
jgi:hypothetical protein